MGFFLMDSDYVHRICKSGSKLRFDFSLTDIHPSEVPKCIKGFKSYIFISENERTIVPIRGNRLWKVSL